MPGGAVVMMSLHKVLKNFPTEDFLHDILKDKAAAVKVFNLKYYWILTYQVASGE